MPLGWGETVWPFCHPLRHLGVFALMGCHSVRPRTESFLLPRIFPFVLYLGLELSSVSWLDGSQRAPKVFALEGHQYQDTALHLSSQVPKEVPEHLPLKWLESMSKQYPTTPRFHTSVGGRASSWCRSCHGRRARLESVHFVACKACACSLQLLVKKHFLQLQILAEKTLLVAALNNG